MLCYGGELCAHGWSLIEKIVRHWLSWIVRVGGWCPDRFAGGIPQQPQTGGGRSALQPFGPVRHLRADRYVPPPRPTGRRGQVEFRARRTFFAVVNPAAPPH